ncbi:MAG: hypothetical protein Q4C87_09135 [Actinomycetaceae bacterium]|nr:hypothetical protein [Actinomycetaceae bacterium]
MDDDSRDDGKKNRVARGKNSLRVLFAVALCLFILLFGYDRRGHHVDGLIELQQKQEQRLENKRQLEQAKEAVELQEELRKNSDSTLPGTSIERERLERIARDRLFQSGALESQSDGVGPQSEGAGPQSEAAGVDEDSEVPTE